MPLVHVPSSMLAPFMRLGYFAKLHLSCSAPRFCIELMVALAPTIPRVSPPIKFDFYIDSKCVFICVALGRSPI